MKLLMKSVRFMGDGATLPYRVVLYERQDASMPYVTWLECYHPGEKLARIWGHYFSELKPAVLDFIERIDRYKLKIEEGSSLLESELGRRRETWQNGGINWVWYYDVDVNETAKSVKLLRSYRIHRYRDDGGEHPTGCPSFELMTNIVPQYRDKIGLGDGPIAVRREWKGKDCHVTYYKWLDETKN